MARSVRCKPTARLHVAAALAWAALAACASAWVPPTCSKNADCDGVSPEDGAVIEGTGIAALLWAGANMTNATYCAQLNGTTGCMPCAFYALESVDMAVGVPTAAADGTYATGGLEAFEGMKGENCYTYNGFLSAIDVVWFDKDSPVDAPTDAQDIRGAGCGQCDAHLPEEEQGGTAGLSFGGTVCKLHSDCQAGHYCDKVSDKVVATCDEGRLTHFTDQDATCNEPFDCGIGTDNRAECLGNSLRCWKCPSAGDETADFSLVHCHSMVPDALKNFMSSTSRTMRVVYGGLICCTLVYPIWCSVVFFLKNFTRKKPVNRAQFCLSSWNNSERLRTCMYVLRVLWRCEIQLGNVTTRVAK